MHAPTKFCLSVRVENVDKSWPNEAQAAYGNLWFLIRNSSLVLNKRSNSNTFKRLAVLKASDIYQWCLASNWKLVRNEKKNEAMQVVSITSHIWLPQNANLYFYFLFNLKLGIVAFYGIILGEWYEQGRF